MVQRWGLALSGGSIRAAVHIGVLQALEAVDLRPEVIAGTSGGAIVAAMVATGLSGNQMEEVFRSYISRRRALVDWNWWGLLLALAGRKGRAAGFLRGMALERSLQESLGSWETLAQLGTSMGDDRSRLLIHAVDLHDGRETLFCDTATGASLSRCTRGLYSRYRIICSCTIARAGRASCSIPGVFQPTAIGGQYYVDGGIRQGYPLQALLDAGGVRHVLGVQLGYAGERKSGLEWGLADVLGQSLDIMMLHQYRLVQHNLRTQAVGHGTSDVRAVTLLPRIYDVGMFDLQQVPRLIAAGRQLAEGYLKSRGIDTSIPAEQRWQRLFPNHPGVSEYPDEFPAKRATAG